MEGIWLALAALVSLTLAAAQSGVATCTVDLTAVPGPGVYNDLQLAMDQCRLNGTATTAVVLRLYGAWIGPFAYPSDIAQLNLTSLTNDPQNAVLYGCNSTVAYWARPVLGLTFLNITFDTQGCGNGSVLFAPQLGNSNLTMMGCVFRNWAGSNNLIVQEACEDTTTVILDFNTVSAFDGGFYYGTGLHSWDISYNVFPRAGGGAENFIYVKSNQVSSSTMTMIENTQYVLWNTRQPSCIYSLIDDRDDIRCFNGAIQCYDYTATEATGACPLQQFYDNTTHTWYQDYATYCRVFIPCTCNPVNFRNLTASGQPIITYNVGSVVLATINQTDGMPNRALCTPFPANSPVVNLTGIEFMGMPYPQFGYPNGQLAVVDPAQLIYYQGVVLVNGSTTCSCTDYVPDPFDLETFPCEYVAYQRNKSALTAAPTPSPPPATGGPLPTCPDVTQDSAYCSQDVMYCCSDTLFQSFPAAVVYAATCSSSQYTPTLAPNATTPAPSTSPPPTTTPPPSPCITIGDGNTWCPHFTVPVVPTNPPTTSPPSNVTTAPPTTAPAPGFFDCSFYGGPSCSYSDSTGFLSGCSSSTCKLRSCALSVTSPNGSYPCLHLSCTPTQVPPPDGNDTCFYSTPATNATVASLCAALNSSSNPSQAFAFNCNNCSQYYLGDYPDPYLPQPIPYYCQASVDQCAISLLRLGGSSDCAPSYSHDMCSCTLTGSAPSLNGSLIEETLTYYCPYANCTDTNSSAPNPLPQPQPPHTVQLSVSGLECSTGLFYPCACSPFTNLSSPLNISLFGVVGCNSTSDTLTCQCTNYYWRSKYPPVSNSSTYVIAGVRRSVSLRALSLTAPPLQVSNFSSNFQFINNSAGQKDIGLMIYGVSYQPTIYQRCAQAPRRAIALIRAKQPDHHSAVLRCPVHPERALPAVQRRRHGVHL